jgi:hypothetical protein
MTTARPAAVATLMLLAILVPAGRAQSLADVAKKGEEERAKSTSNEGKKSDAPRTKSYSDKDLKPVAACNLRQPFPVRHKPHLEHTR